MNNTDKFILALMVVSVCIVGAMVMQKPTASFGNAATATNIGAATTSAAVTVTSSTRVLATTTNALGNGTSYTRVFASICNPSATLVYLNMNNDIKAALTGYTAVIGAAAGYSACYEVTDRNAYQGSIQASSTNQTSVSVNVTEYVK